MAFNVNNTLIQRFIFQNNYVENQGTHYRMTQGLGTGGHSSTIIGDIIINYTYIIAVERFNKSPRNLNLFVDDSWGIWGLGKELFNEFLECLNSIWDSINFIPTFEDNNRNIIFLDIVIMVDKDLSIQHTHYIKPTSSNTYLHYLSHSPMNTKINIIKTEAARVIRNCSKLSYIYMIIQKI